MEVETYSKSKNVFHTNSFDLVNFLITNGSSSYIQLCMIKVLSQYQKFVIPGLAFSKNNFSTSREKISKLRTGGCESVYSENVTSFSHLETK
jgi:hypothetical protein